MIYEDNEDKINKLNKEKMKKTNQEKEFNKKKERMNRRIQQSTSYCSYNRK